MSELTGVRAKLQAHKDKNSGTREITLDECGVVCTIPNFINHGLWMKAQRIGKGDNAKAQAAFVCEATLFDGEKLTLTDLAEMVPASDTLKLIGEIFGGDEEEAGKGAAKPVH